MKVVILAGGFGTRIAEYTKTIPKPMINIGNKPIIYHIMKHYSKYGFKNFYIALGYKGHVIRKYFSKKFFDWNVNLIETGKNTMTGGRLKRLKKILSKERFMLTYGDGLSNVNINKLLDLHKKNKKTVTLTAVRPPARFGALKIIGTNVKYFKEKSKLDEGWINGGYFVIEPDFLKNIKGDKTYLEKEPLENLAKKKQLGAYKHHGFWQCMDTKRDRDILNQILRKKKIF
ncbi:MAG: glucose-1-phosphate cytidylyltransferase [Candidatus Pelagibacter sp.]|nr:glucose-1-phosphate cytidylyltransferase [Candidatus Pelagibacter sp.]|tara:strand:- start:11901 stop:12590 length:690 start_codon:yes stop_codon:yes gene_type:complete